MRVRYILSEGDAAAFLPSKSHGRLFGSFLFPPSQLCFYIWKWMRIDGSNCFPVNVGRFLRMFLGPINVRANRKDVQLKVKEEYNNVRVSFYSHLICIMYSLLDSDSYSFGFFPAILYRSYGFLDYRFR